MKSAVIEIGLLIIFAGCAAENKDIPDPTLTVMEERSPAGQPLSGTEAVAVKLTARVKMVDLVTRNVALVGPGGEKFTIKAGDQVQRLNEIKPGDDVVVEYLQGVAFEVRSPTDEEKKNPAASSVIGLRNDKIATPGAGAAGIVRAVVKIAKIDKKAGTVTVTLPDGGKQTITARYPENLNRVKVGDTVVVTFAEAVGLSISPAKKG